MRKIRGAGRIAIREATLEEALRFPHSALVDECDRLFGIWIRRTGRCRRCARGVHLQCAHVMSRRYRSIRWDDRNAVCFCRNCHKWQTEWPLEGEDWFRANLPKIGGMNGFDWLRSVRDFAEPDLGLVLYDLRRKVATLSPSRYGDRSGADGP